MTGKKPSLIEPRIAVAVARRLVGEEELGDSYAMQALISDLQIAVPRSEDLVAEASGIPRPAPVRWAVVDRGTWAEANITGMSSMLEPLADKVGQRLQTMPVQARLAQRVLVSAEIGALLGYVSRRVLGQYDVLMSDEAEGSGFRSRRRAPRRLAPGTVLYFLGTNMIETSRRYSFVDEDFSLWVALHEVTHRFQFAGVPWLPERFFGLIRGYFDSLDLGAGSLSERFKGGVRRFSDRSLPPEERNPVYLLASPEQRLMLDDIQALMAVVEGHGNYIMDTVGSRVIPTFPQMRGLFERRRERTNPLQRIVGHLIGLEMKLKQYELGQRFCVEVARRGGDEALARLWSAPESFPRLAELREPERWLRRVA
ncbi:MAG: zinc-dependent metalloprotease [Actinobacteria bacterium]|nr:zinc-dependent metalloprotease [Actinomycetota bacterium]